VEQIKKISILFIIVILFLGLGFQTIATEATDETVVEANNLQEVQSDTNCSKIICAPAFLFGKHRSQKESSMFYPQGIPLPNGGWDLPFVEVEGSSNSWNLYIREKAPMKHTETGEELGAQIKLLLTSVEVDRDGVVQTFNVNWQPTFANRAFSTDFCQLDRTLNNSNRLVLSALDGNGFGKFKGKFGFIYNPSVNQVDDVQLFVPSSTNKRMGKYVGCLKWTLVDNFVY